MKRWFRASSRPRSSKKSRRQALRKVSRRADLFRAIGWEQLEDRVLLTAQLVVDTTTDDNDGGTVANPAGPDGTLSLREAITVANLDGGANITFAITDDSAQNPQTIVLGSALPTLGNDITISGPGADQLTVYGSGQFQVFVVPSGSTVAISGLTIDGGFNNTVAAAPDAAGHSVVEGGGIMNDGNLMLNDDVFSRNNASIPVTASTTTDAEGGAIFSDGTLSLNGDQFLSNSISADNVSDGTAAGGAVFSTGPLTVTSSTFSGNSAEAIGAAGSAFGGAIRATQATLSISDSTFATNSVTSGEDSDAGAISIGSVTNAAITACAITGNSSTSNSANSLAAGGAIGAAGNVTIVDSTISANSTVEGGTLATLAGGGLHLSGSGDNVMLVNCTVQGNSATISLKNNPVTLSEGGAIMIDGSPNVSLTNCTVAGNNASDGGGIKQGSSNATVSLVNTIVAGNDPSNLQNFADLDLSHVGTADHNLIGIGDGSITNGVDGNQVGTAANPIDPMLGPLQNNGGPTETMELVTGSTAIDAGDYAAVTNPSFPGPPFTDQRGAGFPRTLNGTVDIGAFEHSPPLNLVVTTTADDSDGGTILDPDGPDGTLSLREAIEVASEGGVGGNISFDIPGESPQNPQTITLGSALPALTDAVTISGPGANELTISGNSQFQVFDVQPSANVTIQGVTIANGSAAASGGGIDNEGTLTVNGSTFNDNIALGFTGNGSGSNVPGEGGAIANDGGTLTVNSSTFNDNSAVGTNSNGPAEGGAIFSSGTFNTSPALTVNACTFNDNSAVGTGDLNSAEGGAIYTDADLTVAGSTFTGNSVSSSPPGKGGAIAVESNLQRLSQSTITGSTFSQNSAGGDGGTGGAIYSDFPLSVASSTFTNNTAGSATAPAGEKNSFADGGAIDDESGLTIVSTTISGNTVLGIGGDSGGGIYDNARGVGLTAVDSVISGNVVNSGTQNSSATERGGGGIAAVAGSETLTNCTIANNTVTAFSASGGGIAAAGNNGTLTLTNCTVAGNAVHFNVSTTSSSGGGIFEYSGGTANLTNSIVADNAIDAGGVGPDVFGAVTTADHNFIGIGDGSSGVTNGTNGNQVGTAASPIDPKLGPLQNNGGPTQTMALSAGSPAIDAGDNAAVTNPPFPGPPFTDQRGTGFPRVVNGTVDIGAFEFSPLPSLVVTTTSDDLDGGMLANPDGPDGTLSLREAITLANLEGGGNITFNIPGDSAANPQTITLTSALPAITGVVTVTGPGANELTVSGNDQFQVFDLPAGSSVSISGLTVAHGFTNTTTTPDGQNVVAGGAVVNQGTLTMSDDILSNNAVSTTTTGVEAQGGAIYSDDSLTLTGCTLESNSATSTANSGGGAVENFGGTLSVDACSFTNNTSTSTGFEADGGAIRNSGSLTISGSTFSGNVAAGDSTFGGAISSPAGALTIGTSTIESNHAQAGMSRAHGGGISAQGSSLSIVDSTLSANAATSSSESLGGAIFDGVAGAAALTNCTITGNSATGSQSLGGAIDQPVNLSSTSLEITNCTMSQNAAHGTSPSGGGIASTNALPFKLTNTIVAGNTVDSGGVAPDLAGSVTTADHDLIGIGDGSSGVTNGTNGNQVGTAASPIDPKLGTLANNGGPTETMALLAGSTAIDAGDNAAVTNPPFPGPPFTDQRGTGFPRIVNGTVDIGAFESAPVVAAGTVQFSTATFNANETDPSATITLTRSGGSSGAVSATVGVTGGTAIDGTDYNFTSQVVNWADGDTANKTVTIPLIDDNATGELTQTLDLSLSNATGGATIGTESEENTVTLAIVEDNDVVTPGTITWTGGSTSSANWSDPANWDLNRKPINGDSLVFPATAKQLANTNDISGLSVNSITFQGAFTTTTGGYSLSGDDLTVGAGGIADNGSINGVLNSINNEVNLNVTLGAAQSWSINDSDNFHHLTINGNVANGGFALTTAGNGTIDIAGQISGSGSLTVNAGATGNFLTVDLDHANTYTGGTKITNGILDVFADGALGPGGTNDAGTTVAGDGLLFLHGIAYNTPESLTLDGTLGNDGGNSSFAGPITITGAASGTGNGLPVPVDAQISDVGGGDTFTLNGPTLVNNGHADLFVNGGNLALGGNSTVVIDNTLSGTGGLFVISGAVQLGAANTYQGSTFLGGIAEIDVGVDNAIPSASAVTMQAGTGNNNLIQVAGHSDTIGSLAGTESGGGTNTVDLGTGGSLTTGGDNTSTSFAGDITGSGTLTKQGSGRFDLTATNDYTGTTTLAAGTLLVDGSTAAANAVAVDSGATLGGAGRVAGAVVVNGTLSPGAGPDPSKDTGTLSNTAGVTFQSGSTFAVQLGGTAASPTNDQLNSAAAVTLTGASLDVSTLAGAGPFKLGEQFVIVQSGAPITTTFNSLPEGSIVNSAGASFSISYLNDKVTLTALTPLVVTTANDDSDGGTLTNPLGADGTLSLREAIELANLLGGPQTISFDIPGSGVQTIHVGSTGLGSLPVISVPVTIDGYTQPGASANTLADGDNAVILIAIDGKATDAKGNDVTGIQLTGGNSTVRGLAIGNFGTSNAGAEGQPGISITGAGGNTVVGNFIGTDATGKTAAANFTAVEIVGSSNNTVGGTAPAHRNILSGNGAGGAVAIRVAADKTPASGNAVEGNFIGVDVTGTTALDNSGAGVDIVGASGNTVGGTAAGAGNVLSGNGLGAVGIEADLSSITVGNQAGATGLDAQNNVVEGNLIGTDVFGTTAIGNSNVDGVVFIFGQPGTNDNNIIGGTTAAARNVISGNAFSAIEISGDGDLVEGNYIGTDVTGTKLLSIPGQTIRIGNGGNGIFIQGGSNNTIGGTAAGAGNVISGNGNTTDSIGDGIFVEPFYNTIAGQATIQNATGNLIEGNLIGTDATGQRALGNIEGGVVLDGVSGNQVGGTAADAGNVISANGAVGIGILGDNINDGLGNLKPFDAKNNIVEGNFIGTDSTSTINLGNGTAGVAIASIAGSAANNTIGGTIAGAGNTITFNKQQGVVVGHAASENVTTGNAIEGNRIFANGGLGIDLGNDGVTQNTPGGPHTGPNDLQNFPVITSAIVSGSNTTITGTFNSTPNQSFTLEFFSDSAADPSGHGQGQTFLGRVTVPTDASGNANFTATVAAPPAGQAAFSATATDSSGNTSEFSAGFQAPTQTATYLNGQAGDNTVATFVHNLYRELLGRDPENAGQAFWVNVYNQALAGGTAAKAQETVVAGFLASSEYRTHLVVGMYHDFLHRTPEAEGLQFWTSDLTNGMDEKLLLAEFVGSEEYFDDAGGNAAGWVNALYHDLLGRTPEASGLAYWEQQAQSPPPPAVGHPADRVKIALEFLGAPESEHKLLNAAYPGTASVGAPGTPAVGAFALADITGDGWDNLYFQGNLSAAAVDALFTELQAGASDDQIIAGMLDMSQYFGS